MRPREPRRKVFIPARLRIEQQWIDVRVLDVSSRGFKLQAATAPRRGAYIELRRGSQSFVARVVWASEQRFGVRTQDLIQTDTFINPTAAESAVAVTTAATVVERRAVQRRRDAQVHRFDRSRHVARTLEFGWIAAFGTVAVTVILAMVQQALSHPLTRIAAALH